MSQENAWNLENYITKPDLSTGAQYSIYNQYNVIANMTYMYNIKHSVEMIVVLYTCSKMMHKSS